MAQRGANPNVVRNIIYRNKGKLADKRVLFSLLSELWESSGGAPLEVPELELLVSGTLDERDVARLLGRDKRRIYEGFVTAVRTGKEPKLLVTGRPGSGKTLLTDAIQRALETPLAGTLRSSVTTIRQEFSATNLADALLHLSLALGATAEVFGAKLAKVGVAGAYAVQADAQAGVARIVLEQLRSRREPLVLLLHVSQSVSQAAGSMQPGTLGNVPLRLSTPDVPRVGLTEWLWRTLLEPVSRLNQVSLLVSMSELPLTLASRTGGFEIPVKLSPPTTAEARRFVRTLAPQLSEAQQEDLVGRAKRSFEDLRTLTLLTEAREPFARGCHNERHGEQYGEQYSEQLGRLVTGGESRIRDFLEVLAVLSLPEFPAVTQKALEALRSAKPPTLTGLELAFLDAVPGEPECWRPFSRQFSRALRSHLCAADPVRFRSLSRAASRLYADDARRAPRSNAAGRYVHHLFAARSWAELSAWGERAPIPQSLLQQLWRAAQAELAGDPATLETVALRVAPYYVRLGSPDHPDAVEALAVLAASDDPERRGWALVKRAESALLQGRFEEAEALLGGWCEGSSADLSTEVALLRANLARWHSRLSDAAALAQRSIDTLTRADIKGAGNPNKDKADTDLANQATGPEVHSGTLLAVRVGLWAGLVAKDEGDYAGALERFRALHSDDELFRARIRFQTADVLFSLGRLAEAHAALTEAVDWSRRGEAPVFEQARYLARRGTLSRRRGNLGAAHTDFVAARAVLREIEPGRFSLSRQFEQAKVDDEAALNLLAEGYADDAIAALQAAQETFAAYGERYGVDPSFRLLRGRLRLAAAYGCRALNQPYRLPLGPYPEDAVTADLQRARQLVSEVLQTLAGEPRYTGLLTQAQLGSSLLLAPGDAVKQAAAALSVGRYPYVRGRAGAHLAGALLRRGDPGGAHTAVATAQKALQCAITDDYALCAYLGALDAAALLFAGNFQGAHERLASALQKPQFTPYHDTLLRRFGELTERLNLPLEVAALGLGDAPLPPTLRPADALSLRWRQRRTLTTTEPSR